MGHQRLAGWHSVLTAVPSPHHVFLICTHKTLLVSEGGPPSLLEMGPQTLCQPCPLLPASLSLLSGCYRV